MLIPVHRTDLSYKEVSNMILIDENINDTHNHLIIFFSIFYIR